MFRRQRLNNSGASGGSGGGSKGLLGNPPQSFSSATPPRPAQPLLGSHPPSTMPPAPLSQNMAGMQGMASMGGFSGGLVGVGGNQLGVLNDVLLNAVSAATASQNQQQQQMNSSTDQNQNYNQFQNMTSPRDVPALMSLPQQSLARPQAPNSFMQGMGQTSGGLLGMPPHQSNRPTMPQQHQAVSFCIFLNVFSTLDYLSLMCVFFNALMFSVLP